MSPAKRPWWRAFDKVERRVGKPLEDAVQGTRSLSFGLMLQTLAEDRRPLRAGRQALQQGAKVEAGAAADDGQPAPARDGGDGGTSGPRIVSRGVEGVRGDDVEEVVRNLPSLLGRRLGGPDLQTAVHGYRIATDNLAVELLPEGDRE